MSRRKKIVLIGSGIAVAGITCYIMRGRYVMVGNAALNGLDGVTVRPLAFFSKQSVVTVVEREGRGHPGYITKCLETGIRYAAQEDAARAIGVHPTTMSRHILGVLPDVKGLHFERIAA
jgi:hypothetical protein